jgi:hypothetical protein
MASRILPRDVLEQKDHRVRAHFLDVARVPFAVEIPDLSDPKFWGRHELRAGDSILVRFPDARGDVLVSVLDDVGGLVLDVARQYEQPAEAPRDHFVVSVENAKANQWSLLKAAGSTTAKLSSGTIATVIGNLVRPLAGGAHHSQKPRPAADWPDITIASWEMSEIPVAELMSRALPIGGDITLLVPEGIAHAPERWTTLRREGKGLADTRQRFQQQRLGQTILEYFGIADGQGGERFLRRTCQGDPCALLVRPTWPAAKLLPEEYAAREAKVAGPAPPPGAKVEERLTMLGLPTRPLTHKEQQIITEYFNRWEVRGGPLNNERDAGALTELLGFYVPPNAVSKYRYQAMHRRVEDRERSQAKIREQAAFERRQVEEAEKAAIRSDRIARGEPVHQSGNDVVDRIAEKFRREREGAT